MVICNEKGLRVTAPFTAGVFVAVVILTGCGRSDLQRLPIKRQRTRPSESTSRSSMTSITTCTRIRTGRGFIGVTRPTSWFTTQTDIRPRGSTRILKNSSPCSSCTGHQHQGPSGQIRCWRLDERDRGDGRDVLEADAHRRRQDDPAHRKTLQAVDEHRRSLEGRAHGRGVPLLGQPGLHEADRSGEVACTHAGRFRESRGARFALSSAQAPAFL